MTERLRIWKTCCLVTVASLATISVPVLGEEPTSEDALSLYYFADAILFSLQPDKEMATYRSYGGGGVGPQGTFQVEVEDKDRRFKVSITGKLKMHRFVTTVDGDTK